MGKKTKIITQQGKLDKRLWYYSLLKDLKLVSLKQLSSKCILDEKFIPLTIEGVSIGHLESINHSIARELVKRNLLPEIEKIKLVPLTAHLKIFSKRSLRVYTKHNVKNLGDVYSKCVTKKQTFKPISEKGFTTTANYQLALLLKRYELISSKALRKVQRPDWVLLVPTPEEIGKDGNVYISKIPFEWGEETKELIRRAVTRKFRYNNWGWNPWESITIYQLVTVFVRINSNDLPVFYTKNHAGAHNYNKVFFDEHGPQAFPRIRKFLEQNNYLLPEPIAKPKEFDEKY